MDIGKRMEDYLTSVIDSVSAEIEADPIEDDFRQGYVGGLIRARQMLKELRSENAEDE